MARRGKKRVAHAPVELAPDTVYIFTDGSCVREGDGGWAAVLQFNEWHREASGAEIASTNNRMELMAILEGLKLLKKDPLYPTVVVSDSQYCVNTLSQWRHGYARNGWKTAAGADVKNADLIKEIIAVMPKRCSFTWVKGHRGHVQNERCDELAGIARKAATAQRIALEQEVLHAVQARTRTRPVDPAAAAPREGDPAHRVQ